MNVKEFINSREPDWQRLEALIKRQTRRTPLSAAEVHELGILYRAAISDLALARRDFSSQQVTLFLNQLLTRTHNFIYQQDVNDWRQVARYFTRRLPDTFRRTALYTFAAFLLFIIPAIIGYHLASVNPSVADVLGLSEQRSVLANQETWTNIPLESRPYASAFIMTNNIRIAILAFGGGITFGLFTVYILAMNGLVIGGVLGLAVHYGMGLPLLTFIAGHGVIELSVIFISGGAGLQLGWALLNPGLFTRRDALALAAQRAVVLVSLAVPLLVIAGLIEGFVSPAALPFLWHSLIGIGTGVLLYGYLVFTGRGTSGTKAPDPSFVRMGSSRKINQAHERVEVMG